MNWGKFLVGRFDQEFQYKSLVDEGRGLIRGRGWSERHILVLDLQTGEGAIFLPSGMAVHDLDRHRVWVCPLFSPFLEWLYAQNLDDLDALPGLVQLNDAPSDLRGYRRQGVAGEESVTRAGRA